MKWVLYVNVYTKIFKGVGNKNISKIGDLVVVIYL